MPRVATLAFVWLAACAWAKETPQYAHARLEFCRAGLKLLPTEKALRDFVNNEGTQWSGLSARDVPGVRQPRVRWVDAGGEVKETTAIPKQATRGDIVALLAQHGVVEGTPSLQHPVRFPSVGQCKRHTAIDHVTYIAIDDYDRDCTDVIGGDISPGLCECADGSVHTVPVKYLNPGPKTTCLKQCARDGSIYGDL